MRKRPKTQLSCRTLTCVLALSTSAAYSVTIQKANNALSLDNTSSWVGGVIPTALDTAIWDSTVTSTNAVFMGAPLNIRGLQVLSPGGAVSLQPGNPVNLGAGGMDLSHATQNLTLNELVLTANQAWTVTSGRSLMLAGLKCLNQGDAYSIAIAGGGIVSFNYATNPTQTAVLPGPTTITINASTLTINTQLNGAQQSGLNHPIGTKNTIVASGALISETQAGNTGLVLQTLAGLTLNPGNTQVTLTPGLNSNVRMNFASAPTRVAGGTVSFSANPSATSFTSIAGAGVITFGTLGTDNFIRATGTTTAITVPFYTNNTWGTDTNTDVLTSFAPQNNATTNSLRFNQPGPMTLTLSGASKIAGGAILVGSQATGGDMTINGGTLTSLNAQGDLIVFANGASPLVIGSSIINNGSAAIGITKAGTGTLRLSGSNSFSGTSYFSNGVVKLDHPSAWDGQGAILFTANAGSSTSGTFALNGNSASLSGMSSAVSHINPIIENGATTPATLSVNINSGTSAYSGTIRNGGSGSLAINKTGAGTLSVTGTVSSTGAVNVAGGKLQLSRGVQIDAPISISSGATLEVLADGSAAGVVKSAGLSIIESGQHYDGKIELHNNDLILSYIAGNSPYASILHAVKSGLPNFGGDGTGITSADVIAQTVAGTTLAVVDNGATGANGSIHFSSGVSVPTLAVIVKYTWIGDANLDGIVDGSDYALTDSGFASNGNDWAIGDYDYSGTIDGSDYALIDTGFGSQSGTLPEPSSLGAFGILATILRRQRFGNSRRSM